MNQFNEQKELIKKAYKNSGVDYLVFEIDTLFDVLDQTEYINFASICSKYDEKLDSNKEFKVINILDNE